MQNTSTVKVACLQMNSTNNVHENLGIIERALSDADPIDLLVLPENFAQMPARRAEQHIELMEDGSDQSDVQSNNQYDGQHNHQTIVQRFLVDMAARHAVHIVAGSLPTRVELQQKPFARCHIVGPSGPLGHYDKLHLFDVDVATQNGSQTYRESDSYQAGSNTSKNTSLHTLNIDQNTVRLGASICYDLRFPELYRQFAASGAQMITVPAAFTYHTGEAHWETLLRARAIENQAFVLAAAQTGEHANGRKTWGHSMVIDPWGDVIARLETETGLLYADLDLDGIEALKGRFPVHNHRRIKA